MLYLSSYQNAHAIPPLAFLFAYSDKKDGLLMIDILEICSHENLLSVNIKNWRMDG